MTTLRDQVFDTIGARRYKTIDAPPFGEIRIQSITELERATLERSNAKGDTYARARMIALAIVDAFGHRVFGDADVESLANADAALTLRLSEEIAAHWANAPTGEQHVKN